MYCLACLIPISRPTFLKIKSILLYDLKQRRAESKRKSAENFSVFSRFAHLDKRRAAVFFVADQSESRDFPLQKKKKKKNIRSAAFCMGALNALNLTL
jgi:hypothetical protein